jgi:hypothetical protein
MKPIGARFQNQLTNSSAFRYNSPPFGGRPSGAAFLFRGAPGRPREVEISSLYKELDR